MLPHRAARERFTGAERTTSAGADRGFASDLTPLAAPHLLQSGGRQRRLAVQCQPGGRPVGVSSRRAVASSVRSVHWCRGGRGRSFRGLPQDHRRLRRPRGSGPHAPRRGRRPRPRGDHLFRRPYLECGILCFGFARALCTGCGTGFVVAFSCKSRGVYPSWNGRHMAQTAAHLARGSAASPFCIALARRAIDYYPARLG
jgi:hypothetical protein